MTKLDDLEKAITNEAMRRSPLIQRPIDNTALDAYMACPTRFKYAFLLHRRRKANSGGSNSPALSYGTAWHAAMEAHYKTNGDKAAVIKAIVMAWQPHGKPDDHRTVERCIMEYDKYVALYGLPEVEAKGWGQTVGWPDAPLIEMPVEASWPGALHPYAGKIDRVFEQSGLYYVEDHKTTSQMGSYYFNQFDPNNQMMGYAWDTQQLTGLPIAGVRINAHCVLKGTSKFERQIVSYSQQRLQDWAENYNYWVSRIEQSIERDEFPRNFNACAGKYGQCVYTEVCSMNPANRQKVLEHDFEVHVWNPLAEVEDE